MLTYTYAEATQSLYAAVCRRMLTYTYAAVTQSLGALIRNAAFISPDVQQAGVLVALAAGLREKDAKVRRTYADVC